MIIQASNRPLVIGLRSNVEDAQEIHVDLHNSNGQLKHWREDDIDVAENVLICPITQTESAAFSAGPAYCCVKWLDADGVVHQERDLRINIGRYADKHIMGDDDPVTSTDIDYTGQLEECEGILNPESIRTAIVIKAGYCTDTQAATAIANYMALHASEFKGAKGDKGDKGDTGPQGPQGPAGSDASVTASNISSALGYTPQKQLEAGENITISDDGCTISASYVENVNDVTLNGESIVNANHKAVIPIATRYEDYGVVKFSNDSVHHGITINDEGNLELHQAQERLMPTRDASRRDAITSANLDMAVRYAMGDGKGQAWSNTEKTNARTRMGAAATVHTHASTDVSGLSTVATSGSYNDLSNKPTIPDHTVTFTAGEYDADGGYYNVTSDMSIGDVATAHKAGKLVDAVLFSKYINDNPAPNRYIPLKLISATPISITFGISDGRYGVSVTMFYAHGIPDKLLYYDVPTASEYRQIKEDITTKLTEPTSGLAVGKYFKVASIDSDGHAVLEACDLPVATPGGDYGLAKYYQTDYYGITKSTNGFISVKSATNTNIDGRSDAYRPIVPSKLVYAVDSVLCSTTASEALTTTQQAAARERLGAVCGRRPIAYTELTEEKDYVVFNVDDNGDSFSLDDIQVNVYLPAKSGLNGLAIGLNANVGSINSSHNIVKWSYSSLFNNGCFCKNWIKKDKYWNASAICASSDGTLSVSTGSAFTTRRGASAVRNNEWSKATTIAVACGTSMPIGTTIEIFGR